MCNCTPNGKSLLRNVASLPQDSLGAQSSLNRTWPKRKMLAFNRQWIPCWWSWCGNDNDESGHLHMHLSLTILCDKISKMNLRQVMQRRPHPRLQILSRLVSALERNVKTARKTHEGMTWQPWGTKAGKCRLGSIFWFQSQTQAWSSYDYLGEGYKTIVQIVKTYLTKETVWGYTSLISSLYFLEKKIFITETHWILNTINRFFHKPNLMSQESWKT